MNTNHRSKRLLSLLLALCMMLGVMPTAFAHAEGEEDTDHDHDATPHSITIYNEKTPNKNGTLTYTVTCHEDGTVSELYDVNDTGITAVEGDIITLYPEANEGYVLSSIGYVKSDRIERDFTIKDVDAQEDGSYTFTMPAYPVHIGAAFYAEDDLYVIRETGTSNAVANIDPLIRLNLGLRHAWLHENAEEVTINLELDSRILDLENISGKNMEFRIDIRQVGDSGFVVKGSRVFSAEELATLADDSELITEASGRAYYLVNNISIPVFEDADFDVSYENAEGGQSGYQVYCAAMFTLEGWTNAIGAQNYRWGYSGGDRAFILENDAAIPTSMVYLYNLDPNTYTGMLVADVIDRFEEENDFPIETRYFTPENMTECIGYLAEWPGYESFGELGVDREPSEKVFKKNIILYCNIPFYLMDKLIDEVRDTGANALSSKLTEYGAQRSFEQFYKTQETESEVFTAALALSLLTYKTYTEVPESEYGDHELWIEFKTAYDEAKAIIGMSKEQEISVYTNARLKLQDVYLRIIGKTLLEPAFSFILEDADDDHYRITIDQTGLPEDLILNYYWYDASAADYLIIAKNELYKVRCTLTADDSCPYELLEEIRLAAPAELEYSLTATDNTITVDFTEYASLANTPEPITYIAELYQGEELKQTLSNETAESLTFTGLTANTDYTLRLYATNIVGRTTYHTETIVTCNMTVDGKTYNGIYSFDTLNLTDTTYFPNGSDDAYQVTINGETQLVGDTTLKNWVGNWETWQKWIYPDAEMLERYPYLEEVWETAYAAYIKAFEGTFMEETIKAQYKTVDDLKQYWYDMTYTNGVENITVSASDDGYTLTWLDANGLLASDSYTMTGKILNGLEGAVMYVFTADTLTSDSLYKYLVTMVPDMEGSEETPIARHYHFQFGSDLDKILANGQLVNGLTYDETTGKKVSDMVDKYWYATMTDADASDVAKYNVILGMHRAEKWSELPETESGNDSNSASSGNSNPNSGILGKPAINPNPVKNEAQLPFTDVAADSWYRDNVAYVMENGLMTGTSANTFSPSSPTTRAMLMTILARLNGVDTEGGSTWYAKGVQWAVANGVSDGSNPAGEITREQLATMLWRYAGEPKSSGNLNTFSDASSISEWAKTAMAWAVENGILQGDNGALLPGDNALRCHVAAMLQRFCENILQ